MPEDLNFHFPLTTLLQQGDLILNAAAAHPAEINARLADNEVATARALADTIVGTHQRQKSKAGDVGTLTKEQNKLLAALGRK